MKDVSNVISPAVGGPDNAPGLEHPTGAYAVSIRKPRVKPSACFFITVDLPLYYASVRKDLLEWFTEVLTFCIAVETSRVSKRVSYHCHMYFQFENKIFLSDLRKYVDECLDIYEWPKRFDIQSVKSTRNVLKYISKEDRQLLYNCKLSMLNFNYRSYVWACDTPVFSHADPFVQEHRFCYRFLEKMFIDVKNSLVQAPGLRKCVKAYQNWSLECCLWWNKRYNCNKIRQKQLFLYGNTLVGKSTYIEFMIGACNRDLIYFPGVGKFFMQGYKPGFHKVILFEEFHSEYYPHGMLKRLLEGRPFSYPVKGSLDLKLVHRGPIIFVSNYYPNDFDDALKGRFVFVSAPVGFWEMAEALLPKEETDDTDGKDDDEISICELSEDEGEEENKALHQTLWKEGYF